MERILKLTGLISALLVFVGYVNLHAYYRPFGIQIWNYLTTGELLLSFLPLTLDIMFLLSVGVVAFLIWRRVVEMFRPIVPTANEVLPDTMEHWRQAYRFAFKGSFKPAIKHIAIFLAVTVVYAFVLYAFLTIVSMFDWQIALFPSSGRLLWICLVCWVFLAIVVIRQFKGKDRETGHLVIGFMGVVLLMTCVFQNGQDRAGFVLDRAKGRYAKVMTASDTIISSDQFVFVGKCQSAVFFYDREDRHSVVVPMSDVTRMELDRRTSYGGDIPGDNPAVHSNGDNAALEIDTVNQAKSTSKSSSR